MAGSARKGAHYKQRGKQWLEANGWTVAFLERVMWIPPREKGGRPMPVKRDQLGSDLLAVNQTPGTEPHVMFVQVKLGRGSLAAAVREFRQFPCPPSCRQVVMVWEVGGREPDLVDAATYVIRGERGRTHGTLFED